MIKFYTYILVMLLIGSFIPSIKARDLPQNMGLVVSPAVIDVSLEKGKVYTRELLVKNTSSFPTGFVVRIEKLLLADFASVSDEEIIPPAWIDTGQQEFILNPGEVRRLDIIFSPSATTPPGGYYGILYIQPVADVSHLVAAKTTSVPKVGVLLLAKVKGKIIQNTVFTGFNSRFINTNSQSIKLGFENLGNVHSMPGGEVLITNLLTKRQHKLLLTPTLIFPNSSKEITLKFDYKVSLGLYKVEYVSGFKSSSTTVLFLNQISILVAIGLTFLIMLFTLYIKKYFMSGRHEERI